MSKENEVETVDGMIISDSGVISLMIGGAAYNVSNDHVNYDQIITKLKSGDHAGLVEIIDVSRSISEKSGGIISVIDGNVNYKGREIINPLTDRIIRFMKEGLPFEPMVKFLENLMDNPSRTSVQELYLFLENNELPITSDGHFLAYKKVREDFTDIRTGTFDNSVGQTPEMPRNEVCDDRDRTCSDGLHFCSKEYLPCFGSCRGNKVMVVKINPADVVSIPSDYNNAKGRTWKYEVIGDCTEEYLSFLDKHGRIDLSFFEHLEKYAVNDRYTDEGSGQYEYEDCEVCGTEFDVDDLNLDGECSDCQSKQDDDPITDPDDNPVSSSFKKFLKNVGIKPSGQKYHNRRGSDGRFS